MQPKAVSGVAMVDRCELCGANAPATFVGRTRHLRKEHPAYARGLLLRILAPVAFLAAIVGLQALEAPSWTAVLAAALSAGLALGGLWMQRAASGTRPSFGSLFREGGYRFVLLAGIFAVMLILTSTR